VRTADGRRPLARADDLLGFSSSDSTGFPKKSSTPRRSTQDRRVNLAEAAWGIRPERDRIQIKKFTPFRNAAGTVRGFVDVQLPSGLIINSIKLMVGAQGAHWLAMPAVKAADKEGNEVTKPRREGAVE
jgi:DNA-binding cell septation regulator SpoVG